MKATENGKKLKPQRAQRHKLLLSRENTEDTEKSKIKPWDEITTKSWKEFCDYCNKQQGSTIPQIYEGKVIFRGHAHSCWELVPSFLRMKNISSTNIKFFEEKLIDKFIDKWLPVPNEHIGSYVKHNLYIYILPIMQHYGIKTRLLDWTSDWRVAACFAVEGDKEDIQHDNFDGAVWCIYQEQIESKLKNKCNDYERITGYKGIPSINRCNTNSKQECQSCIFFRDIAPTDLRMMAQSSIFTYYLDNITDHSECIRKILGNDTKKYFKKIIIPAKLKPDFRNKLQSVMVTKDKIFPEIKAEWFESTYKDTYKELLEQISNKNNSL